MVRKPRTLSKFDRGEDDDVDEVEKGGSVSSSCRLYEERDMDDIHVTLECKDLWMKFHELGTEMIITKAGRLAMFVILNAVILPRSGFYKQHTKIMSNLS